METGIAYARRMSAAEAAPRSFARTTFRIVGWLFVVELVSGILQGYYVTIASEIVRHLGVADADYNWFEAGQLLVSAIVVPVLAKLGDTWGHKKVLLLATVITAGALWWLAFTGDFWSYLVAWSLAGFYVVWLPLEIALIFDRGRKAGNAVASTRRASGTLVVALELGAIAGALLAPRLLDAAAGNVSVALIWPAAAVTAALVAILLGVPASTPQPGRRLDGFGFVLLSLCLLLITGGLTFLRLDGPGTWWAWLLIVVGLLALWPFGVWELRQADPAIDLRVLRQRTMWPVQATAGLIGISLLGAQGVLSTFAGTDPGEVVNGAPLGYGLGLAAGPRSYMIGGYLISLVVGAVLFAAFTKRLAPRLALLVASVLVALGYLGLVLLHGSLAEFLPCMVVAGLGSGALVAALPATAAAAAPEGQTGIASGLTNTTKTIGGSFSSAVFGIVLASGLSAAVTTAAPLAGYLTAWSICAVGAVLAFVLLLLVPRDAFGEAAAS